MYDFLIIGAGVIGCAIFSRLSRCGAKVALVEKGNDVSLGCSRANSGIIHAGFDATPGTKKAEFNVRGNFLMDEEAERLSISFKRCGALVLAERIEDLGKLLSRGVQNNVKCLEIIGREQIEEISHAKISQSFQYALYAPTSGIISPYEYTIALCEEGIMQGGEVFLSFEPSEISEIKEGFSVKSREKTIECREIINCSGAGFNEVSSLIGAENYPITFRRGQYFVLDTLAGDLTSCTLFPLPTKVSKGILITPTVSGNILIGPTAEDGEKNVDTTSDGLSEISQKAKKMVENVPFDKIIREYAGVRVISGEDFVIEKSRLKKNVLNIAGICSPGLTAAPAIAEYVASKIYNLNLRKDNKKRIPPVNVSSLNKKELARLIEKNPDYGAVVCRCELVTLGEIKDALARPLRVSTVDGIKRRTRAGMGRCQGGYCMLKVLGEIAEARGMPRQSVQKDDGGIIIERRID